MRHFAAPFLTLIGDCVLRQKTPLAPDNTILPPSEQKAPSASLEAEGMTHTEALRGKSGHEMCKSELPHGISSACTLLTRDK